MQNGRDRGESGICIGSFELISWILCNISHISLYRGNVARKLL